MQAHPVECSPATQNLLAAIPHEPGPQALEAPEAAGSLGDAPAAAPMLEQPSQPQQASAASPSGADSLVDRQPSQQQMLESSVNQLAYSGSPRPGDSVSGGHNQARSCSSTMPTPLPLFQNIESSNNLHDHLQRMGEKVCIGVAYF